MGWITGRALPIGNINDMLDDGGLAL